MQDNSSQSEHSIAELLKQIATTMGREGLTSLTVTASGVIPTNTKTGEELAEQLEKAFLGEDFPSALLAAVTACEESHAKGESFGFNTNSFKDSFVYPGKKFPAKCFIQHSKFNIQAVTKLGDFIYRFCGDSRINQRLACIDGYCREYENAKLASDDVNKKDFVCILNRE